MSVQAFASMCSVFFRVCVCVCALCVCACALALPILLAFLYVEFYCVLTQHKILIHTMKCTQCLSVMSSMNDRVSNDGNGEACEQIVQAGLPSRCVMVNCRS
jgi:hypothetical protein